MTAFRPPALCQQALAEGAYACLAKPFRLQERWDIVQPPYRAFQRQRRADKMTPVDRDNS